MKGALTVVLHMSQNFSTDPSGRLSLYVVPYHVPYTPICIWHQSFSLSRFRESDLTSELYPLPPPTLVAPIRLPVAYEALLAALDPAESEAHDVQELFVVHRSQLAVRILTVIEQARDASDVSRRDDDVWVADGQSVRIVVGLELGLRRIHTHKPSVLADRSVGCDARGGEKAEAHVRRLLDDEVRGCRPREDARELGCAACRLGGWYGSKRHAWRARWRHGPSANRAEIPLALKDQIWREAAPRKLLKVEMTPASKKPSKPVRAVDDVDLQSVLLRLLLTKADPGS
jgi:hypothetical protein